MNPNGRYAAQRPALDFRATNSVSAPTASMSTVGNIAPDRAMRTPSRIPMMSAQPLDRVSAAFRDMIAATDAG